MCLPTTDPVTHMWREKIQSLIATDTIPVDNRLDTLSPFLPLDQSRAKTRRRSWFISKCVRWSCWLCQTKAPDGCWRYSPSPPRPAPVRLRKAPTASYRQTSSWRAPPPQGMEMSDAQEFGDQAQLLLPFPGKLPQGLQQKQRPQENLFSTLSQFITSATEG